MLSNRKSKSPILYSLFAHFELNRDHSLLNLNKTIFDVYFWLFFYMIGPLFQSVFIMEDVI